MATIPAGTKFIGIGASVPTPENKSSQNNGFQEVYTLEDLQENVLDLTTPPDEGDVLTYTSGAPAWAPPAGGSEYTETIVNISSAQILFMGANPIELLPAPGAGKYYDIDKIILEFDYGSVSYGMSTNYNTINIGSNPFAYLDSGNITANENTVQIIVNPTIFNDATDNITSIYNFTLNQNVSLTTYDASNPTLGDGTLRVKIYHKTITFGA